MTRKATFHSRLRSLPIFHLYLLFHVEYLAFIECLLHVGHRVKGLMCTDLFIPRKRCYYYTHIKDVKTDVQDKNFVQGQVTC